MARGDEGKSMNAIHAPLVKFQLRRAVEEYHNLGDTQLKNLRLRMRNITPFSTPVGSF
jgi:hypothetical protein